MKKTDIRKRLPEAPWVQRRSDSDEESDLYGADAPTEVIGQPRKVPTSNDTE